MPMTIHLSDEELGDLQKWTRQTDPVEALLDADQAARIGRFLLWLSLRLPCEPIPLSIRPILTSTWSPD